MDRSQFLTEWTAYPAAPNGCKSLARWKEVPGWVGGQLGFVSESALQNGFFFLFSEQSGSLEVEWKQPFLLCRDDSDSGQTCPSPEIVLRPGDLVAIEIDNKNANGSWRVQRLILLAPSESPPAPNWNKAWPQFMHSVREHFIDCGFQEIETPTLVNCPGLEPALEPFQTDFNLGSRRRRYYLPTSPEIHLKKALCSGLTDIFEIKTCFRNGEISEAHQPEFWMLEWYRAYSNLDLIVEDLAELLARFHAPAPQSTTFAHLFAEHVGESITPRTTRDEILSWCHRLELFPSAGDSATDLFHRIWLDKIEPNLTGPIIVRDFPPAQAALARLKTDGWADRFEFFWNGLEIANAFHEVNDPREQAVRWKSEAAERSRLKRSILPEDDDLLFRMKMNGLPPTGGIALGIERLFMALHGIHDIRTLRLFPYR